MRIRSDLKFGTITDNPLVVGGTSVNSAQFATLPTVAGSDELHITLDPEGSNREIVKVTAHSAAATVCTIARGQLGTSAAQHALTTRWVHGAITTDLKIPCTSSTRPTLGLWEGMTIVETDTDLEFTYDGAAWVNTGNLGAWPTWTPTLTQSTAVAKTITRASWTRQGRMISGDFQLAVTAAGTANAAITVHLPVPAAAGYPDGAAIGSGYWLDASSITCHGNLGITTDDRVAFYAGSAANAANPLGLTASPNGAAIASGDLLVGTFRYEAAS